MTTLTAGLFFQLNLQNFHTPVDALTHVVDCHRTNTNGGDRLHFGSSCLNCFYGPGDFNSCIRDLSNLNINRINSDGVAHRDQIWRSFGRHDRSNTRYLKNIAFLNLVVFDQY